MHALTEADAFSKLPEAPSLDDHSGVERFIEKCSFVERVQYTLRRPLHRAARESKRQRRLGHDLEADPPEPLEREPSQQFAPPAERR